MNMAHLFVVQSCSSCQTQRDRHPARLGNERLQAQGLGCLQRNGDRIGSDFEHLRGGFGRLLFRRIELRRQFCAKEQIAAAKNNHTCAENDPIQPSPGGNLIR